MSDLPVLILTHLIYSSCPVEEGERVCQVGTCQTGKSNPPEQQNAHKSQNSTAEFSLISTSSEQWDNLSHMEITLSPVLFHFCQTLLFDSRVWKSHTQWGWENKKYVFRSLRSISVKELKLFVAVHVFVHYCTTVLCNLLWLFGSCANSFTQCSKHQS